MYKAESSNKRNRVFEITMTPAFVYDERTLSQSLRQVERLRASGVTKVLFSLKAFSFEDVLRSMHGKIDGLAASSLFEARLARGLTETLGTVHFTSPGLRPSEIVEMAEVCDYISCNSLSQWKSFKNLLTSTVACGLRINPELSFVNDGRYDPCRRYSKLGIPMDQLIPVTESNPSLLKGISGLHFHTNCDSRDFSQVLVTVRHLDANLWRLLKDVGWINLGGGYLFDNNVNLEPFCQAIHFLRSKYGVEIYVEPGASLIRDAGFLVSSVLDLFTNDDKTIAILDTTVNHMPEVFEYRYEPDVLGHVKKGRFEYILAGCSCLAGDVFGKYAFNAPLEIGSRVVFSNVGAYTLVKAHMFNGINLPTIYTLTEAGDLVMRKQFTYDDFASRSGAA